MAFSAGRFPSRRLILGGLGLFVVGSLVCATAPVFPVLLLGRVLQACATGVVMSSVFAIILMILPVDNLGTAMGVIGLIMLPGAVVGAVCGLGASIIFDHRGVRGITLAGAGILLVGAIGYATISTSSSVPMICLVYSIACIGSQLLITPLNT